MPIVNGTTYHSDTDPRVIEILEDARQARLSDHYCRLRISYGDPHTGKPWGNIDLGGYSDLGYIGRSSGTIKVPLMLPLRSSRGGGAILDHKIVRIEHSSRRAGGVLYESKPRQVRQSADPADESMFSVED